MNIGWVLIQSGEDIFVHPTPPSAQDEMGIIVTGEIFPNIQQKTDILAGLNRSDRHEIGFVCPWTFGRRRNAYIGQSRQQHMNPICGHFPCMVQYAQSRILRIAEHKIGIVVHLCKERFKGLP